MPRANNKKRNTVKKSLRKNQQNKRQQKRQQKRQNKRQQTKRRRSSGRKKVQVTGLWGQKFDLSKIIGGQKGGWGPPSKEQEQLQRKLRTGYQYGSGWHTQQQQQQRKLSSLKGGGWGANRSSSSTDEFTL